VSHRCRRAAAGGRPWRGGVGPGATRGEDAHTETRRRELSEEPDTAVNTYTMSASSSSRRRLHHHPAVRTSVSPFFCATRTLDSVLVGMPSNRRAPCATRRRSPMDIRRATRAPVRTQHRGYRRPQRRVRLTDGRRADRLPVEPGITPRHAVVPSAVRASCLALCGRPSCHGDLVRGMEVRGL
jgi:hypothetical protein